MNKTTDPKAGHRKNKRRKGAVERWQPDPAQAVPAKKNPIHSLVTTLPVIMLLAGLWVYYSGESKQRGGEPVLAEMVAVSGLFSGTSEQNSSPGAQRILWVKTPDRLRGGRLDLAQFKVLQQLQKNQLLEVWMAPRVQGSNTYWVLKVVSDGQTLLDQLLQSQ